MADVQIGGRGTPVGSGFGTASPDVYVTGALGTPVFDGTIEVENEGPILQPTFENKSPNVYLYPGAVIYP